MILDELIEDIKKVSNEKVVQDIAQYINNWKNDNRDIMAFDRDVEKYLGNIWIDNTDDFGKIYKMWTEFKKDIIININGMTVNERLYVLGLFERFDSCKNEDEQNIIYEKINANNRVIYL